MLIQRRVRPRAEAGTATASWSGTLSSAKFYVETVSSTTSFNIDDASFK
jgi:hypothetical protein